MDADLLDILKAAAPAALAEARRHHSPGPWTCDEENCGGGLNIRDRHGNVVLHSAVVHKHYERVTTDNARANARLAAAAPDMLLALQALVAAGMGCHPEEYERQVREIAAAAIPENI